MVNMLTCMIGESVHYEYQSSVAHFIQIQPSLLTLRTHICQASTLLLSHIYSPLFIFHFDTPSLINKNYNHTSRKNRQRHFFLFKNILNQNLQFQNMDFKEINLLWGIPDLKYYITEILDVSEPLQQTNFQRAELCGPLLEDFSVFGHITLNISDLL